MFIKCVGTRTRGGRGGRGRTRIRGGRRGGRGGRGAYCASCYRARAVRAPDTKTSPSPRFDVPNFVHVVLCSTIFSNNQAVAFFLEGKIYEPIDAQMLCSFQAEKEATALCETSRSLPLRTRSESYVSLRLSGSKTRPRS
jgi:hypothetical protein